MNSTSVKSCSSAWRKPPAQPEIGPEDTHVWRIELDLPDSDIDNSFHLLSADERARSDRFVFKKDRSYFIAARGALRRALALYLQADPAGVQFYYGSHGKPSLKPGCNTQGLRFNMTHSSGIALLALTMLHEIGVDVERIRDDFPCLQIARQFFSNAEYTELYSLEPALRHEAFFNCWTRKEAFIKATGKGLSYPLKEFDVSLRPGSPARLLRITGGRKQAARYSLHAISPRAGYVGAIAVIGACSNVLLWAW
jgi:4'-phosphopantetheinyl transferase